MLDGVDCRGKITCRAHRENGRTVRKTEVLTNGNCRWERNPVVQVYNDYNNTNIRGEIINGIDPDDREPDPERLLLSPALPNLS